MKTTPLPEILKQITPLPLKVDRAGVNLIDPREKTEYVLAYCKGSTLAEVQSNAAYLAHAANVLPGLVASLRELVEFATDDRGGDLPITDPMIKRARQALSIATNVPVNS